LTTDTSNGRHEISADVSPAPGATIVTVSGIRDLLVPPEVARDYIGAIGSEAGRSIEPIDIPDAGHFELGTPGTAAWSLIHDRILDLVGAPRSE
jgi:fermentation-respiration switch protein FrsA (DUF1100 family)